MLAMKTMMARPQASDIQSSVMPPSSVWVLRLNPLVVLISGSRLAGT